MIYEEIKKDKIKLMKEKSPDIDIIKMLINSIDIYCKDNKKEVSDEICTLIINKQIKLREKVLVDYKKYKREDLVSLTEKEISYYKSYITKPINKEI